MGSRRHARELALQVLYQLDIKGNFSNIDDVITHLKPPLHKEILDYVHKLADGVKTHKNAIDAVIETSAENWSLNRMEIVDRNILRLAVFEMLYCPDIPYKVAIDEALEIGKKYGTDKSSDFINGILDRISKQKSKVINNV